MTSSQRLHDELAELVAIPSVSADPAHAGDVVAAAEWVASKIRAGGGTAELVAGGGGRPLVVGEIAASHRPESAPTVLCYAHFDVQPPDPLELWETPPFELALRDGKLFGRGVADDKGNLYALVEAACELAAEGALPVNVRMAFDGEEEVGGVSIVDWLEQDERGADAALILDGAMVGPGRPAFYIGVRGMLYLHLRVRTGMTDLHSGMYGGAALNAIHALLQGLSAVIAGPDGRLPALLREGVVPPTEEELEAWAELRPGGESLASLGASPLAAGAGEEFYVRTFADTSLDVNGIAGGSPDLVKTVLPVEARANVSIRLAYAQDPERIRDSFERLVRSALPEGAELTVEERNRADPAVTASDSHVVALVGDAFAQVVGAPPLLVRSGGTLPVYAGLVHRGLPTLATGFGIESEANVHAPNENVPADAIALGVATMREVYRRLGNLAD